MAPHVYALHKWLSSPLRRSDKILIGSKLIYTSILKNHFIHL
jgi:hypothetical protein